VCKGLQRPQRPQQCFFQKHAFFLREIRFFAKKLVSSQKKLTYVLLSLSIFFQFFSAHTALFWRVFVKRAPYFEEAFSTKE